MAHTLVLGVTQSGKSTYSKWVCERLTKKGIETAVLNPYRDPGWICSSQHMDPSKLLDLCLTPGRRCVFLEEAGDTLDRDPRYNWFTTVGRHAGNQVWVISQRMESLNPTLRNNCVDAVVFASEIGDTKLIANRYREPRLLRVEKFRPGQFYMVSQFSPLLTGQLNWDRKDFKIEVAK